MNINQKLDKILLFLAAHKERHNVNVNSVHQQVFDSKISLDEAQQLFEKVKQSGKTRVLGHKGRYIGWSIDTGEFLEKGGFEGHRDFRLELLQCLNSGQNNITELLGSFIDKGPSYKLRAVNILRELADRKWIIVNPPDYRKINFQDQSLDFDIHATLTTVGAKESLILLMGQELLKDSGLPNSSNNENSEKGDTSSNKEVFLSYCWKNKEIADRIFRDLSQLGIKLRKDDHTLKYKDKISNFMETIRDSKFAILIISNEYLRSKNCMTEVLHLLKERDCVDKIMPIIVDGTQIYSSADMATYIAHWQNEADQIRKLTSSLDPVNSVELAADLRQITFIANDIGGFIKEIRDMLHVPYERLTKEYYKPLLDKMGFTDMGFAVELFRIAHMEDIEEREIALDNYARRNPQNSYYYFLKGSTAKMAGKFKLARESYSYAVEKDKSNTEALNNLGLLLMEQFKELPEARILFETAVDIQPNFTIARLNLGTVLSRLNENEKAREQYEQIIAYDPAEPRAYNNLANYYRSFVHEVANSAKAEELLRKAIELQPDYIEAHFNLANLLKTTGRKTEGNEHYQRVKELDTTGNLHIIVDKLIASEKG